MLKKVLVIANPGSGKNKAVEYAGKLTQVLLDEYQAEVTVRVTEKVGDATEWAAQFEGDSVLCLGGDGTVNETAQGVLKNPQQPNFGFIPLGTVNDVYFINTLAVGSIATSVMETDSDDKNTLGFFAYVKDAVSSFFESDALKLTIDDGKNEYPIETNLVVCALTNSVGGFEQLVPEATIDDGKIHLLATKGSAPQDLVKAAIDGGLKLQDSEHLLVLESEQFNIRYTDKDDEHEVYCNIDGDKGPAVPLSIKCLPQAIKVLQPVVD
ncbi:diacylglycerol/lipid kinase family protein [Globicatella sanguinis]|uniref:diacylglycerol/lipid kinase family protein n=1 Tax=Globicatella sanguinis TaxID=13076 RepID=UPI0008254572|nr:diacylglycerol kinase family protein [Globicatella sanguinis]